MQAAYTKNKDDILFYLLILTGFFLLLETSFFIQSNRVYLADFSFVSEHLHIPASMWPAVFFFIGAQLLLHFIYCFFVYCVSIPIANLFRLEGMPRLKLAIGVWLLGIVTALVANQYYFPNSKFAELMSFILRGEILTKILLYSFVLLCAASILLMLFQLTRGISKTILFAFIVTSVATWSFFSLYHQPIAVYDAATKDRPNIIIVGVDSLRPDFVQFFGGNIETPFMDSFLERAVVFSEAVTPLARTFPSWASILTGEYPLHLGARFNLAQPEKIKLAQSLPAILRQNGYETIFATDETRFSNIDKNFGFDQVVSPPVGLNDFLLGTFNDFPFSNLLVNTPIGKWLFPYSYANRPVFFTYDPNSFLKLIDPAIPAKRNKPLFLAVHFCLPHSPYLWSALPSRSYTAQERYEQSIGRVDKQLFDFFVMLRQRGLLDHAIVVLLSDHGEALELAGDRLTEKELFIDKKMPPPQFYPPSLDDEAINQSAGHGTDVLGLTQYHTLLAFKLYGTEIATPSIESGVVSLVDVQPTILQLLGLNGVNTPAKGSESLAPRILGQRRGVSLLRHVFIESDFSPESIRTVYPETRKVLLDGIELFQINPSTLRLTVKDNMAQMIIHSKQYADIYDDWMLALYPQNQRTRMPILINLVSGQWTNDLHSPFAQQSPAAYMLEALKAFYGPEIDNI
jgi:arylsulfatase A-like enzyme